MNLLSLGKNTFENTNKLLLLMVLLARTGADALLSHVVGPFQPLCGRRGSWGGEWLLGWGASQRAPAPPFSFLSALQAFPFPKVPSQAWMVLTQGVHTSQLCYSLFEKNGRQVVFLGVWLF